MSLADLLALFLHCLMLSLLAIGGAIATVPDLQRFVVVEHGWVSVADFNASIALAQAAPGPNLLFVAVVGFNAAGLLGALVAMSGMLLPSTVLTLAVTRWGMRRRDTRGVKAFVAGMAPITLGLLASTGWLLAAPVSHQPVAWLLIAGTVLLMWRTRLSPLWALGAGAVLGGMGGV